MLTDSSRRIATVFCFAGFLSAAAIADTAEAQYRGVRRSSNTIFTRVYDRRITTELELTDEVQKKIKELSRGSRMSRDDRGKYFDRINKARTETEKAKIRAELTAASEKISKEAVATAMKLLTDAQRSRFGQLKWRLHPARYRALLSDDAVAILKITDDQKKKMEKVIEDRGDAAQKAGLGRRSPVDAIAKFQAEWDPKTVAVLNAAQQKQWMAMIGPDLKANTAAAKVGNSKTVPGLKTPAGPVTPTPAVTQTKAAPKDFVASFDASTAAQRKKAAVKYGTGQTRKAAPRSKTRKKGGMLSFNFRNAPWKVVFDFFAAKTGLALDNSKSPPDTFTYEDPNLYTHAQALDVLNGYLLQKNFILVRRHQALVVHDLTNPVPASLVPDVALLELPDRGRNELMRVTFQLKENANPVEVSKDVEALAGDAPYNKVVTFATARQVIVTNIGSTLLRIEKSLKDVIEDFDDTKLAFRRFVLEHVPAKYAVEKISEQLGITSGVTNVSQSAGGGRSNSSGFRFRSRSGATQTEDIQFQRGSRGGSRGGSDSGGDRRAQFIQMMRSRSADRSRGSSSSSNSSSRRGSTTNNTAAKVTADDRTNSVLVTAPYEQIKIVEEIVLAIDVPTMEGDNPFLENAEDNEPYLKVYKVYKADVMEVTKTLNALLPGLVVNEDGRNGLIHIMATRSEHAFVTELLKELDPGSTGGGSLVAIQLNSLDPVPVSVTLNAMFSKDGDNAPSIQADAGGRRLLIRGSEAQVASIRSFVQDLDGKPGAPIARSRRNGNTVVFQIPGDPKQFLKMIEGSLPGFDINIVVPSGPDPIRDRVIPSQDRGARPDRRERLRDSARGNGPGRKTTYDYERPVDRRGHVMARRRDFALGKPARKPAERREPVRRVAGGNLNEISALLEDDEKAAPKKKVAKAAKPNTAKPDKAKPKTPAKSPAKKKTADGSKPRVSIVVQDGSLVITSNDPAALDRVQGLVEALLRTYQAKTSWTVFYLRTADATQTATMLEQIFPASSVSNIDAGGTGLMGGLTNGLSNFGSNLMDVTGLSSMGQAETLRIIPDVRSNSLFVSGPASNVRDVERVLKILDTDSLPASLRDRVPRMIPVYYANVNDVYLNVSEVYKDYMQATRSNAAGGANVLAMLAGGGGRGGSRGGRGGGRQQQQQQQVRLTLSVDERTGQLIVSSSDALFQQIDDLVFSLDKAAFDAKPTSRVVLLENATPSVIAQTLTSMYPNVTVTVPNSRDRARNTGGNNPQQQQQSQGDQARAAFRAQMMQRALGGGNRGGTDGGRGARGGANGFNPRAGGTRNFGGSNRGGSNRGRGGRGR